MAVLSLILLTATRRWRSDVYLPHSPIIASGHEDVCNGTQQTASVTAPKAGAALLALFHKLACLLILKEIRTLTWIQHHCCLHFSSVVTEGLHSVLPQADKAHLPPRTVSASYNTVLCSFMGMTSSPCSQ